MVSTSMLLALAATMLSGVCDSTIENTKNITNTSRIRLFQNTTRSVLATAASALSACSR